MRYEKQERSQEAINESMCLRDYFPDRDKYTDKTNAIKAAFCRKLKEIQNAGKNTSVPFFESGLDEAETAQLIAANYGYTWDTIPFMMMDALTEFVKNNGFRYFQICETRFHAKICAIADGTESVSDQSFLRSCKAYRARFATPYNKPPIQSAPKYKKPEDKNHEFEPVGSIVSLFGEDQ